MLPKILYIYLESDPQDKEAKWFVADEELENCANQATITLVGTYELKELNNVRLVVTSELVKEKAG